MFSAQDNYEIDIVHPPADLVLPIPGQRLFERTVLDLKRGVRIFGLSGEQIAKILVMIEIEGNKGTCEGHGVLLSWSVAADGVHDAIPVPAYELVSVPLYADRKLNITPGLDANDRLADPPRKLHLPVHCAASHGIHSCED
jgi:hypothetical protein